MRDRFHHFPEPQESEFDTEGLDSKRLKENDPDLYAKYAKTSRVKASLIIKNK